MGIDLDALRAEAEREDNQACVVTRRWLRQALVEITEARRLQSTFFDLTPALDVAIPPPPAPPPERSR